MNAVTWAALSAYAQTLEGQAVPGLGELLRAEAPRLARLRAAAQVTAQGCGVLDERGELTPQGLASARARVARLGLGRAGGEP
ncbi:hypothetical protein [Deinococcus murrayi]|uniref:hypothetical protein n=1 Tax=Deinococcus murrayi TaxID=68910 RepID=UPI00146FB737|nr:hypothetical protein [Deinococcus murrayi]